MYIKAIYMMADTVHTFLLLLLLNVNIFCLLLLQFFTSTANMLSFNWMVNELNAVDRVYNAWVWVNMRIAYICVRESYLLFRTHYKHQESISDFIKSFIFAIFFIVVIYCFWLFSFVFFEFFITDQIFILLFRRNVDEKCLILII